MIDYKEYLMVINHVNNKDREERENPMGFKRNIPFNKLPLLTSIDLSEIYTNKLSPLINDLNQISSHLDGIEAKKSIIDELWQEEYKYSNLIENIKDDNQTIALAYNHQSKITYSNLQINAISKVLSKDKPGIRRQIKGKRVYIRDNFGPVYTPPSQGTVIKKLLADLRVFNQSEISIPFWIKIVLEHYQYESIHPLYDGNGRSGRIMLLNELMSHLNTNIPIQISKEIFDTQQLYYSALNAPRLKNDYSQIIEYFMGVFEEALIRTLNEVT
jgi:Fic family protein